MTSSSPVLSASPTVSVLLPCHDCASTLPAALNSLRRQTLTDLEIIKGKRRPECLGMSEVG